MALCFGRRGGARTKSPVPHEGALAQHGGSLDPPRRRRGGSGLAPASLLLDLGTLWGRLGGCLRDLGPPRGRLGCCWRASVSLVLDLDPPRGRLGGCRRAPVSLLLVFDVCGFLIAVKEADLDVARLAKVVLDYDDVGLTP